MIWPLVALGVLTLLPSAGMVTLRVLPQLQLEPVLGFTRPLPLLSSFITYASFGWLVAAILLGAAAVRARRPTGPVGLTVVALAGLALQLSWIAPDLVPDHRPGTGPSLTVMSLNMRIGQADATQVVRQAQQADVVVLVESTPEALAALDAAGMTDRFGYAVGDGRSGPAGATVFARYPVRTVEDLRTSFQQQVTSVEVPDLGAVTLIAAHPCNPLCGTRLWDREAEQLREAAGRYADTPTVIAGDFNAVDDQLPMQRLRRDGFASATDVAGAGLIPTYPANSRIPPVIGIDHVMINSRLTATAVTAFTVAGTDHRGLLATLTATA